MQTETTTTPVLVKDPHTFARPEEAVIKHLDLDLSVNFEKKILTGTVLVNKVNSNTDDYSGQRTSQQDDS